jgi:hypothetical protein
MQTDKKNVTIFILCLLEIKELTEKNNFYNVNANKGNINKQEWTPFPTPVPNNIDYSKHEPASIRMTLFKNYPVLNF